MRSPDIRIEQLEDDEANKAHSYTDLLTKTHIEPYNRLDGRRRLAPASAALRPTGSGCQVVWARK